MKSNIQKVYSKLPKQKLSAQKVELGLVDDLKELVTDAKRIISLQEMVGLMG